MTRKYLVETPEGYDQGSRNIAKLNEQIAKFLASPNLKLGFLPPGCRVKEVWIDGPATAEGEQLAKMYEAAFAGNEVARAAIKDWLEERGML